jgi:hypothetical protein
MQIKLSFSYVITFLLLLIVMLELHETVHITVGYFICGCWGVRDFNVWSLCDGCYKNHSLSWLATLAGPLFSFAVMWFGRYWLSSSSTKKQALGFSLIFANIPFGRISEAMKGAGDEMVVTKHLLKGNFGHTQLVLICSLIVLAIGLPPIVKAFRILTNKQSRLYITGFLTLPLLFLLVYVLIALNSLLKTGFLSTPWLMNTPLLITVHTALALFFLLLLHKNLFSINSSGKSIQL